MKNNIAVLGSDSLNRAGFKITLEALSKSLLDQGIEGVPSFLNHDFHRPIGWVLPYGLLIEPKISKTIGNFFYATTDEEEKLIKEKISHSVGKRYVDRCSEHIERFETLLDGHLSPNGKFYFDTCIAYHLNEIVEKVYPQLITKLDKDGLLYLDDILAEFEYMGGGVFKNKKDPFAIFAHQYFRRNLSHFNTTNSDFLEAFFKMQKYNNVKLRIAIDNNLIGLWDTYQDYHELDYWWGPKFDDDIEAIPNDVTRYESDEQERLLSGIQGTEFWWKTDEDERTLEMEEIQTLPSMGVSSEEYGCRYIHSIYNVRQKIFKHFDGAVRIYSQEGIMSRWDMPINKAGKNTVYTKLFRIDGELALSDWKLLCIYYFRNNSLVYEYFNKKKEVEELMERKIVNPPGFSQFAPFKTRPENGVQLFITNHSKREGIMQHSRTVVNPDTLNLNTGEVNVVECDVLEVRKFLLEVGEDLHIPEDIKLIKAFDHYVNYPIIYHFGEDLAALVKGTLDAYKRLFKIISKQRSKVVSFSVMMPFEKGLINISVFGEISSVLAWLNFAEEIPLNRTRFENWIEQQAKWLYCNYAPSDNPHLIKLLKPDGYQFIKRIQIDPEIITAKIDDNGLRYETDIPEGHSCYHDFQNGLIYPAPVMILDKIICSETGVDYRKSSTSKYLHENVTMEIHKCELMAMVWTDRPY